jgi:hypothetical protein
VRRMVEEVSSRSAAWLETQRIFQPAEKFDVESETAAFFRDYLAMPFRDPTGGSRFGNLLWLNLIAKAYRPDVIVDSGTYTGASAWALARGAPKARLRSHDPDLSRLRYRAAGAEYLNYDWMLDDPAAIAGPRRLFYFDDHIDQGRRLREAHERNGDVVIFDDDFSILSFATMAHGGLALPKISFILDERLEDGETIEWIAGGVHHRWIVDRHNLDSLRSLIGSSDRLPDLSSIVGIWQLPYRVVGLTKPTCQDAASPPLEHSSAAPDLSGH